MIVAPLVVGAVGVVIERLFLQWLYRLDHLYGLLLTFGLALIIEGVARNYFGSAGLPYSLPESLGGGQNLGFMFLPNYRAWVIVRLARRSVSAPGSRSSAPGSAPTCAPRRKTRRWCAPSASTCRA